MNVNLEQIKNFNVLTVREERIDAHNSAELKETISQMLERGENSIVVQLKQVRFIDSSGLGALLFGHKQAAAKSGQFALTNIQPQVLSMFELTRLTRVFEIYPDIEELLAT
jgi:anti-anti-sigma factor